MIEKQANDSPNCNASCIKLGTSAGTTIYIDLFHSKTNGHVSLFGESGTGKTYCIENIICELADLGRKIIILDVSGSLSQNQGDEFFFNHLVNQLDYINVAHDGIMIDIFQRLKLDEENWEQNHSLAGRLAESLSASTNNGAQQSGLLYDSIMKILSVEESTGNAPTLEMLRYTLSTYNNDSSRKLLNKMNPLFDGDYFYSIKNNQLLGKERSVKLLQLQSLPSTIKKILIDQVLWQLWSFAVQNSTKQDPVFVVLDEFQNANLSVTSPLYKILCEGRKFGINLILASQFNRKHMPSDMQTAINQVGNKLFFRPPDIDMHLTASRLSFDKKEIKVWEEKLSKLTRGEVIARADLCFDPYGKEQSRKPLKVKIKELLQ